MLARRSRTNIPDINLDRDHLMPKTTNDLGEQLKPKTSLIRNQNTKRRDLAHAHDLPQNSGGTNR